MALASLLSPAPYHILSYSMMLGSSIYHTFINQNVHMATYNFPFPTPVMDLLYRRYFVLQTVLPVVIALTFPSPRGILALWDPKNRVRAMLPVACMFATALWNQSVLFEKAREYLEESRELAKAPMDEQQGGRHYKIRRTMLAEQKLDMFTVMMGLSGAVNFVTLFGAVAYGFSLASRLR